MIGGETNGRKDERGGRLASLPALRRQDADAGSAAHGAGGFSAVLPKVQIQLCDSIPERKNRRVETARRLDAVQSVKTGLHCVFCRRIRMKTFMKKHPALADACDAVLSLLSGNFALLAIGLV